MPTAKEAENTYHALDALTRLEFDIYHHVKQNGAIPPDWEEIAAAKSVAREHISIRLDADVLKFLRTMGPGYQARINAILRGFMHARLARLIDGPEGVKAYRNAKGAALRAEMARTPTQESALVRKMRELRERQDAARGG